MKGVAYVGALQVLEEYGYHFNHYVGTSAGAISAALLASGYSPTELGEILATTNFKKFKDGWLPLSLMLFPFRKGLYRGEAFRVWIDNYLRQKFPYYSDALPIRFRHIKEVNGGSQRLTVFASVKGQTDYPFDSQDATNSETEISFACRCSMAIPYLFRPERIAGKWVVDGGMQNNYPINALLRKYPDLKESADFLGLYIGLKSARQTREWLLLDLLSIWSESADEEAKEYFIDRTIVIDPRPVKTTDFSLSQNDISFLLAEGRASALRWLYYWSDGKRPTLEMVEEAEKEAAELRGRTIIERWRKFWPKFVLSTLLSFLLLTGLVYGAYSYIKQPRIDSSLPLTTFLESETKADIPSPSGTVADPNDKLDEELMVNSDEPPHIELPETKQGAILTSKEELQTTTIEKEPNSKTPATNIVKSYSLRTTYEGPGRKETTSLKIEQRIRLEGTEVSDSKANLTIGKTAETKLAKTVLIGRIINDGKPVEGAQVSIEETPGRASVETSDDGRFLINDVPRKYGQEIGIRIIKEGRQYTRRIVLGEGEQIIELTRKK